MSLRKLIKLLRFCLFINHVLTSFECHIITVYVWTLRLGFNGALRVSLLTNSITG